MIGSSVILFIPGLAGRERNTGKAGALPDIVAAALAKPSCQYKDEQPVSPVRETGCQVLDL